jgi:hypothetical protein
MDETANNDEPHRAMSFIWTRGVLTRVLALGIAPRRCRLATETGSKP